MLIDCIYRGQQFELKFYLLRATATSVILSTLRTIRRKRQFRDVPIFLRSDLAGLKDLEYHVRAAVSV